MNKFKFPPAVKLICGAILVAAGAAGVTFLVMQEKLKAAEQRALANEPAEEKNNGRAVLTVNVVAPQTSEIPTQIAASGNVAAWQEALVGSEMGGLRLADVLVNVGDNVRKGQVLARFATESLSAEVAAQQAAVSEAQASRNEAQANADRANSLQASGAISAQQILQFETAAKSAAARLESAKARLAIEQIRRKQTQVLAPDHGMIAARMATVGQVTQPGQELFKLIRQSRLEWRAEVTAAEALGIKPGQTASVIASNGSKIDGKVRTIAPSVDAATRNVLVYVDLVATAASPLKAGMFAKGQFELGRSAALTVPQQALVLRDGFAYLFVTQPDNRVKRIKVSVGRRLAERVEITAGLQAEQQLVATGAAFLADGDRVKIIAATNPAAAPKP